MQLQEARRVLHSAMRLLHSKKHSRALSLLRSIRVQLEALSASSAAARGVAWGALPRRAGLGAGNGIHISCAPPYLPSARLR